MPDVSMVHVDQALTNVSIAYQPPGFYADELFPPSPVGKQSNKYFVYDKSRFRVMDDARRPGAQANEIDWKLSTDTYYCEGHALSQIVPDELRSNADPVLDLDVDTTEILSDLIYLQREILAASKATDISVVAQHKSAAAWDNNASTPITDIETAKLAIQLATGKLPNRLLVSRPVFEKLRNHASIIGRVQFVMKAMPEDISAELLASAFGLEKVVVADSIKNTANEGAADSMDWVWGKNAILYYRPAAVGKRVATFGAQFRWLFGANTQGFLVKRWREEKRTGDMIEVQLYHDMKVVAAAAAYLFDGCIS